VGNDAADYAADIPRRPPAAEEYLARQFRFRMAREKIIKRTPDALAV
jgi:hypothetical protein